MTAYKIIRYDPMLSEDPYYDEAYATMEEDKWGEYVKQEDYEILEKKIAELEKEKAELNIQIEVLKHSDAEYYGLLGLPIFEAYQLEQQAKGLNDYVVETMDNSYILHLDPEISHQSFLINLNATASRLRNQAKELKEDK
jgi:hypothetical protein